MREHGNTNAGTGQTHACAGEHAPHQPPRLVAASIDGHHDVGTLAAMTEVAVRPGRRIARQAMVLVHGAHHPHAARPRIDCRRDAVEREAGVYPACVVIEQSGLPPPVAMARP